jgi:endonuclease G
MKQILLITLSILYSLIGLSQDNKYLPESNGEIVKHSHYTLSYIEKYEHAEWVAYELDSIETIKVVERNDRFKFDNSVSTGSAKQTSYSGFNVDRGHLAPAADMCFSYTAMQKSFYMSNMSPQLPSFNRGVWKRLEKLVRSYATEYKKVYVVTGAVLNQEFQTVNDNVSIPLYYYKIILRGEGENTKMIAFLLKNEKSQEPLSKFVVNTDFVESLTGIDFFPQLEDDLEDRLESKIDSVNWFFKASKTGHKTVKKTKDTNGRCCGITKSGNPCTRKAKKGSKYCWQHQ